MSKCFIDSIGINPTGEFCYRLSFGFMSLWCELVNAEKSEETFDEYIYNSKLHIGSSNEIIGNYPNRTVIVHSYKNILTFKETKHTFNKYYKLEDLKRYILVYKNIDLLNYSHCTISKQLYYDSSDAYKYIMFALETDAFAQSVIVTFLNHKNMYISMFDDNAYVNHNLTLEEFNDIRQWKS